MASSECSPDSKSDASDKSEQHSVASNRPDDAHCPLLALPAELRLEIFNLVIVTSRAQQKSGNRGIREPYLLATCTQIRNEMLPDYERYLNVVLTQVTAEYDASWKHTEELWHMIKNHSDLLEKTKARRDYDSSRLNQKRLGGRQQAFYWETLYMGERRRETCK